MESVKNPARFHALNLSSLQRYAAAMVAVICALALRLVFAPLLADHAPFLFFLLTIVVVKSLWGRGPALLATLLGGIAAGYFLLAPPFTFAIRDRADALNLAAYFVVGCGISYLGETTTRLPSSLPQTGRNVRSRILRQTTVLAGAALVLTGMVLLLLHEFRSTQEAERWVSHTYRLLNSAESLFSVVKDAEAGQRGFLLTSDSQYLAPYHSALSTVPKTLQELKQLTADNPRQRARLTEIGRLADERLSVLGRSIDLHNAGKVNFALSVVRSGEGKRAMDKLRSATAEFEEEEFNLLEVRRARAQVEASRERWVLGLGCATLIALLVFASVVIERETVRREQITEDLRRHAHLLEQAHDSLLVCRLHGPIDYWSRGAERLFGYTQDEARGQLPHELLQTSHPDGVLRIDALLEREGRWQGELTQTAKDGRKLMVEARWMLSVDGRGNKTVLEANHDITERKRAEAQNLLLATAIEQAVETVVVTDHEARIQYVNPAFTRTTGYSREEALGQNPRVLKSGQHGAQFYQALWSALGKGELWQGEFTNRRKDGTLYIEEATIAPVRAASGEITNYIAIKSDVTERRKGEAALRESEMMLRFFVQHAPAAIAMLDRQMRYLVVSTRWLADYHLPDRQIEGLSHYELFPEIPERWKEIHRRCLAGAVERCEEDPFPRPDGSLDWVRWEVRPWRRIDDSIGGIIIFSELITDRKRAEEELRRLNAELESRVQQRTAALETANRELEAFAHSVSHDLRAPLRGIDGWSLALLEDCGERLDPQGRKYLDRVREEAQRMGRLIDDLLHLSRVSRTEIVLGPVDLTCLAQTIAARLQETHPERQIEFVIAPQLTCQGDARLLEIALTNLLANSVKFTGLRARAKAEFGRVEHQGKPAFFVRDNGVGFDMAYAKMLFAPFQRLHKTSEFPGTGIGLATVQRVIHRHDGRIWAEARVGAGATFYFTLGDVKT